MPKIALNSCHGSFGLSEKAILRYAKLKKIKLWPETVIFNSKLYWIIPEEYAELSDQELLKIDPKEIKKETFKCFNIDRTDPILIQVVEELGDEANAEFAHIEIKTIRKGKKFRIIEIDGYEDLEFPEEISWQTA